MSLREDVLFYIGYRTAKVQDALPFRVRAVDIQLPARHIIALVNELITLDELIQEVDEEFGNDDGTTPV